MKNHLLPPAIIVVLATVIMLPRLTTPEFGLLDDGVTIHVSQAALQAAGHGDWGFWLRVESSNGRFKPAYWLFYALQYAVWGPNALGFFVVQWLCLVLTGIAIYGAVAATTRDRLASLSSGAAYILASPVIENYYTLSKAEPPMVLWLALSLLFLLASLNAARSGKKGSRVLFAASIPPLFVAYFTKETALAMVGVGALWAITALVEEQDFLHRARLRVMGSYFIINLVIALIYWTARVASGTASISAGAYSSSYSFAPGIMYASLLGYVAWYIRDFPYLLPVAAFLVGARLLSRKWRSHQGSWLLIDGVLWVGAWTAIMLPWHSALEYYLLPAAVGLCIVAGIGLSMSARYLRDRSTMTGGAALATLACASCLILPTLGNSFTSARIQIAIDSVNADLIDYLASKVPARGTVLVNLPEPNEYEYEIGQHLAILKQRPDIQVRYLSSLNPLKDSGVFVVTPIMQNQPLPIVRVAVYESGAAAWDADLQTKVGSRASLVHQQVSGVQLLDTAIEEPICGVLNWAKVEGGVYCGAQLPTLDTRRFEYGWKVYRLQ